MMRDSRYGSRRWQRVRLAVLRRDLRICRVVSGCAAPATVADHIIPATPAMPDVMFFNPVNLRASCHAHNFARALAPELDGRASSGPTAVVTRDYTR